MSEGVTGGALSPWFVLLRDLSVKSTLLLLAAWALTLAMRRASAATRHLVWLLTFAGLLLLPLLSLTLPPRPVAVLPAAPPDAPLVLLRGSLAPRSEDRRLAPNSGGTVKNPEKRSFPSGSPRVGGGEAILMRPAWTTFLGILWLMGVLLAAFPFDIGWFLAVQRIRRCSPVTDPATLALAAEAGRQLGLRCPVPLRSGASVAVPMTFGLLRPVILLPDGAASWAAERLRVALLHEMAHVRRGDWAIQTTARLVCALFWHNPLVWPAARMLRAEAERACDDLVLSLGIPAPDYAQHLLAVAAALSGATRPLPLAVSMAGRGPLESRLRAVLTIRPRRAPSRRLAACAFALALIVVVPLAILRPAARAARRTDLPLMPAPPEAVRPSSVPGGAATARPPSPVLTSSTPTGVPTMKPLMPVKAVALTALAAALTLPAAQAQPPVPVPPKASVPPTAPVTSSVNPFTSPGLPPPAPAVPATGMLQWVTFVVQHATLSTVRAATHWDQGGTLPEGVDRVFFLESNHSILARSTPAGRARMQEVVKGLDVAPEAALAAPELTIINRDGPGDSIHAPNPLVSLDLKKVPIRQALDTLFAAGKANYTVAAGVPDDKDLVTVHLTNVPLVQALDAVLAASDTPLTYTVGGGGIFAVSPQTYTNFFGNPSKSFFRITQNDVAIERQIGILFAARAAKLAEGVTPNHPDILSLDTRIAELQRAQRAGESGTMKRKPINPAPDKAP